MKLNYYKEFVALFFLTVCSFAGKAQYSNNTISNTTHRGTTLPGINQNNAIASTGTGSSTINTSDDNPYIAPFLRFYRTRGTLSNQTPVLQADRIGVITAAALSPDMSTPNSAAIGFIVDDIPSASNVPMGITFETGESAPTRQKRIIVKSNGDIILPDFSGNSGNVIGVDANGKLELVPITSLGGGINNDLWNVANGDDGVFAKSGNVGIGTAQPQEKLHIVDDVFNSSLALGLTGEGIASHNRLYFNTDDSATVRSTDVNLQFNYPYQSFSSFVQNNPNYSSWLKEMSINPQGNDYYGLWYVPAGASNNGVVGYTEMESRLYIDGEGFVGLGTSRPESKLHVFKNYNETGLVIGETSNLVRGSAHLITNYNGKDAFLTAINAQYKNGQFEKQNPGVESWQTPMTVTSTGLGTYDIRYSGTGSSFNWQSYFHISGDGKIGMGTETPSNQLEVISDANETSFSTGQGANNITGANRLIGSNSNAEYGVEINTRLNTGSNIRSRNNSNFDTWFNRMLVNDNGEGTYDVLYAPQGGGILNNWKSYMHINHEGLVGMGTNLPEHKLHLVNTGQNATSIALGQSNNSINGAIRLEAPTASENIMSIDMNADFDNGTYTKENAAFDSWMIPMAANSNAEGTFDIMYAGAGTNSTPINWESRLHIDNDGNVGIGTTTPSAKLTVDGVILAEGGLLIPAGAGEGNVLTSDAVGNAFWGPKGDSPWTSNSNEIFQFGKQVGINNSGSAATLHLNGAQGSSVAFIADGALSGGISAIMKGDLFLSGDFNGTGIMGYASDKKLKKNIQNLDNALDKLQQLEPKVYEFKKEEYPSINLPEGNRLGLIAQEVQKVLPTLVKDNHYPAVTEEESPIDYLSVNYLEIIPLLIQGVKEQQTLIESQNENSNKQLEVIEQQNTKIEQLEIANEKMQSQIDAIINKLSKLNELESNIQSCCASNSNVSSEANDVLVNPTNNDVELKQNRPNPFAQLTNIDYYIPENVKSARIVITDFNGYVLKNIQIENRGHGQTVIKGNTLAAGVYLYSLILDNEVFESKKMILTK